jgi:hypothetical protein
VGYDKNSFVNGAANGIELTIEIGDILMGFPGVLSSYRSLKAKIDQRV